MSLNRSRRRFLVAASNGLLVGLAGCSALRPSRTQLGVITVLNMDDTVHRVSVEVTADGETVFAGPTSLRAAAGIHPAGRASNRTEGIHRHRPA